MKQIIYVMKFYQLEVSFFEKMIVGLRFKRRVGDDLVKGDQGKGWVVGDEGGNCILGIGKGRYKGYYVG